MIEKIINELHLYEKKLLDGLAKNSNLTPEEIAKLEQMPVKAVTSAAGMLESKNIITVDKTSTDNISLSEEGKDYALNGLPEHRILKALQDFSNEGKDEVGMDEVIERVKVSKAQMNFSIGILMQSSPSVIYMERPLKAASHTIHIEVPPNPFWDKMNNGKLAITDEGKNADISSLPQVKFLKFLHDKKQITEENIPEEFIKVRAEFNKRKDLLNIKTSQDFHFILNDIGKKILDEGFSIQNEATQLTHDQLKTGSWKNLHYRGYDINAYGF